MAMNERHINPSHLLVKKLGEHLLKQQKMFYKYQQLKQKQEESILKGDMETLVMYIDYEKKLLEDIGAFQKVVLPLEELYHADNPREERAISSLKESINRMRDLISKQNSNIHKLLTEQMALLRLQLDSLKVPKDHSSFDTINLGKLVDIST